MFDINIYFVDNNDTKSRFMLELVKSFDDDLPSTFYYELIIDMKLLSINNVCEIQDCISYIYQHYGDRKIDQFLISGDTITRIVELIDGLLDMYKGEQPIDNSKYNSEFIQSENITSFLNVYKNNNEKTNQNIFQENTQFIKNYLSSKQRDKDNNL